MELIASISISLTLLNQYDFVVFGSRSGKKYSGTNFYMSYSEENSPS